MRKKYGDMAEISAESWTTYKDKLNDYIENMVLPSEAGASGMIVHKPVVLSFMIVLEFNFDGTTKPLLFFNMGLEHKKYIKNEVSKKKNADAGFGMATIHPSPTGKDKQKLIILEVKKGKVKDNEIKKLLKNAKVFRNDQVIETGVATKHVAPKFEGKVKSKDKIHGKLKDLQEDYNSVHEYDFDERDDLLDRMVKGINLWQKEHPEPKGSNKDTRDLSVRRQDITELSNFIAEEFLDLELDRFDVLYKEIKEDYAEYNKFKNENPGRKKIEYLDDMLADIKPYLAEKPKTKDRRVTAKFQQIIELEKKIIAGRKEIAEGFIKEDSTKSTKIIGSINTKQFLSSMKDNPERAKKILDKFNENRNPDWKLPQILKDAEALEEYAAIAFEMQLDDALSWGDGGDTGRENLAFGFRQNNLSTAATGSLFAQTAGDFFDEDVMSVFRDNLTGDNPHDDRTRSQPKYEFTDEEQAYIKRTYKTIMDYFESDTPVSKAPGSMKRMAYKAAVKAAEKGAHPDGIIRYLGGAVFLRFINSIMATLSRTVKSWSTVIVTEMLNKQANGIIFSGGKARGMEVFNDAIRSHEGKLEDFLLRLAAAGAPAPTDKNTLKALLFSTQLRSLKNDVDGIKGDIIRFNPDTASPSQIKAFYKSYDKLVELDGHITKKFGEDQADHMDLLDDISVIGFREAHQKIIKHFAAAAESLTTYFTTFNTGTKDQADLNEFRDLYDLYQHLYDDVKPSLEKDEQFSSIPSVLEAMKKALDKGQETIGKLGVSWKTAAMLDDWNKFDLAVRKLGVKMDLEGFQIPTKYRNALRTWWYEHGGYNSVVGTLKPRKPIVYIKLEYLGPIYRLEAIHNVDEDADNLTFPGRFKDF
ncbi:MAG: hypothetical protein AAFV80_15420 [Bacteroidota bacterium]